MNPFGLTATALVVWGIVAHLLADWPLQNAWMAAHKAERRLHFTGKFVGPRGDIRQRMPGPWWDRHPAAYVHAGIHGLALAPVFGWPAALIAVAHLAIDTRVPLAWWSRRIRQDQPKGRVAVEAYAADPEHRPYTMEFDSVAMKIRSGEPTVEEKLEALRRDMREWTTPVYDMGVEVRIWTDQVAHILVIAIAALTVAALW